MRVHQSFVSSYVVVLDELLDREGKLTYVVDINSSPFCAEGIQFNSTHTAASWLLEELRHMDGPSWQWLSFSMQFVLWLQEMKISFISSPRGSLALVYLEIAVGCCEPINSRMKTSQRIKQIHLSL